MDFLSSLVSEAHKSYPWKHLCEPENSSVTNNRINLDQDMGDIIREDKNCLCSTSMNRENGYVLNKF